MNITFTTIINGIPEYEYYFRMFLAFVFGIIIGLERARQKKITGVRTHTIVCLGSCLVMVISLMYQGESGDPMRLSAQVISGITFIGAGVIWSDRNNNKHGLTTAANLWISAIIGLAIGIGAYGIACFTGVLMYIAITISNILERVGIIPADGTTRKTEKNKQKEIEQKETKNQSFDL